MSESFRKLLLRVAQYLEADSHHAPVADFQAAVFSHGPPFEGHIAECVSCQGVVLRERDRNALYRLWLSDPADFEHSLELLRKGHEQEAVRCKKEGT